jgi:hypothetical protein
VETDLLAELELVEPLLHVDDNCPRVAADVVADDCARHHGEWEQGRAVQDVVDGAGPLDGPSSGLGQLQDEEQLNRSFRSFARTELADDPSVEHALDVTWEHSVAGKLAVEWYAIVPRRVGQPMLAVPPI